MEGWRESALGPSPLPVWAVKYIFKKKIYSAAATVLDAAGNTLSLPLKHRRPLKENFSTIVVVRMDHLGDVLLATAVPKILKENFPMSRLIFLTSSWSAPLLRHNPFVDEVILYDAPWFSKKRYARNPESLTFGQLVQRLRTCHADLGIGLRGDARENILLALAGVTERVGYGITGGGFLLTRQSRYREGVHESEHVLDLLRAIRIRVDVLKPQLYFSEDEKMHFEKKLEGWGIVPGRKYVGFQVGAGTSSKRWPARNARSFLNLFKGRFVDYGLVFVGSNRQEAAKIEDFTGDRFLNLTGKTTLRETCLLVKKFSAFVGPDSGPAHIAAVMDVPTVFLYSGTNRFEQWKPLAERALIVRHAVPCSPCELELCNVPGHPCMSQITAGEVANALARALEMNAGSTETVP